MIIALSVLSFIGGGCLTTLVMIYIQLVKLYHKP